MQLALAMVWMRSRLHYVHYDIGLGDEVITTPMTAFATMLAILRAGATPVLADIESETALLDLESVSRCVSPKNKGCDSCASIRPSARYR